MDNRILEAIKKEASLELARRDFFHFCKLMMPKFYRDNREYLKNMCEQMQEFYESDDEVLVVNVPPRHGKSLSASMFTKWLFGRNSNEKVMTASYNEMLSTMFSKGVRNDIMAVKADDTITVYSDVFPNTKIKQGDAAMNLWSLEGGYNNYLATSPGGTATGFGASCFPEGTIIDTPYGKFDIKDIVDKNIGEVLSWSHENAIIKVGNIKAFRRKKSDNLFRIETNSGRIIECTNDHPIFIEGKGYVRAEELRVGEEVKTFTRDLLNMLKKDSRTWEELSRMLREGTSKNDYLKMHELFSNLSNKAIREEQTRETWSKRNFLLERLFLQIQSIINENEQMYSMREFCQSPEKILFGSLQTESEEGKVKEKGKELLLLQRDIHSENEHFNILLDELQKLYSFEGNEGSKEFKLQAWEVLFEGLLQSSGDSFGARWEKVQKLRKVGGEETFKKTRECDKPSCSSYRPKQEEQRIEKLNNSMQFMPYIIAQEEIVKIEKLDKECYVYDIQVEDYHNFFANGILVHNCIIIDDLIKNAEEAFNDMVLEKHWEWFTNTMLSRLEENGKIIIIMTRWSSKDLAGRALKHFGEEGKKMRHINLKAMQDDGTMLCDEVLSKRSYLSKTRAMSPEIAAANYQQQPIDVKGRLYSSFKTYKNGELPRFKDIRNYTDTADTGADFLCSINYGVTMDNEAYILDVLFTDESMEVTEPLNAEMLYERGVNVALIESNNGGRGYARSVENILRDKYKTNKTVFKTFHQTKNKKARILSNSTWVMEHIYFPENWRDKWNDFHDALANYQKNGKNKHDDAADTVTGIVEQLTIKDTFTFG